MPLVRLIEQRDHASPSQLETFDHIAANRGGKMVKPYAAMLHRPEIARRTADLGSVIRFASTISDHIRELAILTAAVENNCSHEWSAHYPLAQQAGVSHSTLNAIASRADVPDEDDGTIVEFIRSLFRSDGADVPQSSAVLSNLGEEAYVELAAIAGFYTMLAVFMRACDIC